MGNGYVAYENDKVVTVITGIDTASTNRKTGKMLQHYNMPKGIKPSESVKTGDDALVCGDCKHRPLYVKTLKQAQKIGKRLDETPVPCYVQVGQGVNAVYKALDGYRHEEPSNKHGRPLRFGAWGNPTQAPYEEAQALADGHPGHTGYTHDWKTCDQRYRYLFMASVDSEEEQEEAQAMGWRTYRVLAKGQPLMKGEIICPATPEGGYKTTCAKCLLCAGTSKTAKNIATVKHGAGN